MKKEKNNFFRSVKWIRLLVSRFARIRFPIV